MRICLHPSLFCIFSLRKNGWSSIASVPCWFHTALQTGVNTAWLERFLRHGRGMQVGRLVRIDCMLLGPFSGWGLLLNSVALQVLSLTCFCLFNWIPRFLMNFLFLPASSMLTTLTLTPRANVTRQVYCRPEKSMYTRAGRRISPSMIQIRRIHHWGAEDGCWCLQIGATWLEYPSRFWIKFSRVLRGQNPCSPKFVGSGYLWSRPAVHYPFLMLVLWPQILGMIKVGL